MACNHTIELKKAGKRITESALILWRPNNGITDAEMVIRGYTKSTKPDMLFGISIQHLLLCKVCGATFATGSDKDVRRRTAATLRELEALADE